MDTGLVPFYSTSLVPLNIRHGKVLYQKPRLKSMAHVIHLHNCTMHQRNARWQLNVNGVQICRSSPPTWNFELPPSLPSFLPLVLTRYFLRRSFLSTWNSLPPSLPLFHQIFPTQELSIYLELPPSLPSSPSLSVSHQIFSFAGPGAFLPLGTLATSLRLLPGKYPCTCLGGVCSPRSVMM